MAMIKIVQCHKECIRDGYRTHLGDDSPDGKSSAS
jgi:hypothetical protein